MEQSLNFAQYNLARECLVDRSMYQFSRIRYQKALTAIYNSGLNIYGLMEQSTKNRQLFQHQNM